MTVSLRRPDAFYRNNALSDSPRRGGRQSWRLGERIPEGGMRKGSGDFHHEEAKGAEAGMRAEPLAD